MLDRFRPHWYLCPIWVAWLAGCNLSPVPTAPPRPIADAGADVDVGVFEVGDTVDLRATVSAGSGPPYSWRWTVERVPGTAAIEDVRFSETTGRETTVGPLNAVGTYSFRIMVTDGGGAHDTAFVRIEIGPEGSGGMPPGGNGDVSTNGGGTGSGLDATFAAPTSLKTDTPQALAPEGSPSETLEFLWEVVTGEATIGDPTAPETTLTATSGGTLTVRLTVTDPESGAFEVSEQVICAFAPLEATEVEVRTNMGTIRMVLENEKTPVSVENFLQYVEDRFYDTTLIDRVTRSDIGGFGVVQGGSFAVDRSQKETRDPIINESREDLSNLRGSVGMARRLDDADSATSAFYINVTNNGSVFDMTASSAGFAVFGRVIEGMDVVDNIARVPVGVVGGKDETPLEDVIVNSIRAVAGCTSPDDFPLVPTNPEPLTVEVIGADRFALDGSTRFDAIVTGTANVTFFWEVLLGDLVLQTPTQRNTTVSAGAVGPARVRVTVADRDTGESVSADFETEVVPP